MRTWLEAIEREVREDRFETEEGLTRTIEKIDKILGNPLDNGEGDGIVTNRPSLPGR